MTHTPGPWSAHAYDDAEDGFYIEWNGGDVAQVYRAGDAELIAAAPDLLDAACDAARFLALTHQAPHALRKLREAIDAAGGNPNAINGIPREDEAE
jgi:hypothetical protein